MTDDLGGRRTAAPGAHAPGRFVHTPRLGWRCMNAPV
jgi:hypothetical protein